MEIRPTWKLSDAKRVDDYTNINSKNNHTILHGLNMAANSQSNISDSNLYEDTKLCLVV